MAISYTDAESLNSYGCFHSSQGFREKFVNECRPPKLDQMDSAIDTITSRQLDEERRSENVCAWLHIKDAYSSPSIA